MGIIIVATLSIERRYGRGPPKSDHMYEPYYYYYNVCTERASGS